MDHTQIDTPDLHDGKAREVFYQVHKILSEHWQIQNEEEIMKLMGAAEKSETLNLVPAIQYNSTACPILVRSMLIENKMYFHFVSESKSSRLDIEIPSTKKEAPNNTTMKRMPTCRKEFLKARIQRNVFNYFDGLLHPASDMAPELDRLTQPVLQNISFFLRCSDFVRLTLTNRNFNKMSDHSEIWNEYLHRDFPTLVVPEKVLHPKVQYLRTYLLKRIYRRKKHYFDPFGYNIYLAFPGQ
uniref:AlNc14C115G6505 protein n=1 Tax=Albugo laibachii Nc14 TaxID=890382 RepID=F0WIW8_9STRA|nr:AlNc14C115G6505 [Albugo laibachii Nc14]|eukprot:CCA21214.1 AlNc14C115G6505 [Albugo laibachii Nc14]